MGLNVASTRLILLDGYAGDVIQSFGHFVVRGNYVVGAVVFLILVVINFVVITKGAGRIAEVAARFTLDSLPGKQMSIDAELNAGLIDEAAATHRRQKLQQEADFYGAMDGASKFVRGDAIAGILITMINVVGGIAIGVMDKGMQVSEAMQRYTLLSIGDGLVSQIPALVVSIAAGILITRTSEGVDLSVHLSKQLRIYPRAVKIAAAMLFIFGLLPGMPFFPFATLAIVCFMVARVMEKHKEEWQELEDSSGVATALPGPTGAKSEADNEAKQKTQELQKMTQVDVLSIELGFGLLSIVDQKQGGDLLERITTLREKFARDTGMIVPAISVRDNLDLDPNAYCFYLRGKPICSGQIQPSRFLAVNVTDSQHELDGIETREPVFDLPAYWISESDRESAEVNGYTVVDAVSVLITHLTEVIRDKAYLMLEREDVQKLIDSLKEKNATLVEELIPEKFSVGTVQRVLQNLLQERISIKNLSIIVETIGDFIEHTKNPDDLSEQVRKRLGLYFVPEYESDTGVLTALTIDPALEHLLVSRIKKTQYDVGLMMDPEITREMLEDMKPRLEDLQANSLDPVLITVSELRLPFKRFFDPSFPKLAVLSYQELPANTQVRNAGVVTVSQDRLTNALSLGGNQELQQAS